MMSRNFTPEQTLIDRLHLDDAAAFDELTRRYCYSLYSYCNNKLNSSEDSRRIVRNIYIALWEGRHSLPLNFSMSVYLYTEIRKAVIQCLNNKLKASKDIQHIEEKVIPGFHVSYLKAARQPVRSSDNIKSVDPTSINKKRRYEDLWWNKYSPGIELEDIRRALKTMLNTL